MDGVQALRSAEQSSPAGKPAGGSSRGAPGPAGALAALCAIARLHHVAADPAALAHQLSLESSTPVGVADLLLAARHWA